MTVIRQVVRDEVATPGGHAFRGTSKGDACTATASRLVGILSSRFGGPKIPRFRLVARGRTIRRIGPRLTPKGTHLGARGKQSRLARRIGYLARGTGLTDSTTARRFLLCF